MQNHKNELVAVSLKTLIDLAAPARFLKLSFLSIRAQQGGGYSSRFKGRGMEFDEARLYQAGDDIRSIDWRVTARTGKAHTKLFREERERPVFICVDTRAAMQFATRGVFKCVLAAKLAALLAWAAHYRGDRIGGQLFSDQYCTELKPQNGKRAVLHLFNSLLNHTNTPFTENISLETVFMRLNQHAHAGSLLYIISDFRGLTDKAANQLIKLTQHCAVSLLFIYDPLEKQLPSKGQYRFTNNQREVMVNSDDKATLLRYQQQFQQRELQLKQLATNKGIVLVPCSTVDDALQCLR